MHPIWDVAKERRRSQQRGKEEEESISFQFHQHQICIKSRVARGDYVTPNFNPRFETADERSTPQGALNQMGELTLQTRFRWPCWTALGSPTRVEIAKLLCLVCLRRKISERWLLLFWQTWPPNRQRQHTNTRGIVYGKVQNLKTDPNFE